MFRKSLTVAFRSLLRNRTLSSVNILGLAIGLTCGLLIFILVGFMVSYDTYHPNADRIYRIVTELRRENAIPLQGTPRPLGDVLRRDYALLEHVARIERLYGRIVSVPDRRRGVLTKFEESHTIGFAEPQFFDIFPAKWLAGNPKTALSTPNTVVLTEKNAKKYFGHASALGQTLRFDNAKELTVTGVIENHPANTNLDFDTYISYSTFATSGTDARRQLQDWTQVDNASLCFVTLREGVSPARLDEALVAIRRNAYHSSEIRTYVFQPQSLAEINFNPEYGGHAPRPLLYALSAMGLFLVIAACINFINLTTARALKRAKEVGIRKSIGSTRSQLFGQFITETALITLVAVGIALLLTYLLLPQLNQALAVLNADLSLTQLFQPRPLVLFIGLVVLVIGLAGFYPSLVLSGFSPLAALRGHLTTRQIGGWPIRRGLVVVQFFITQLFVLGVLVVMMQLRYMQQKELGFRKEAILTIAVPTTDLLKQQLLRNQLRQVPGVEQVTLGSQPPASVSGSRNADAFTYENHSKPEKFYIQVRTGDVDYLPLFGIHLLAGRNFLTNDPLVSEALVNEKMVKQLGLQTTTQILGKRIRIRNTERVIVGVFADFYANGLRTAIPSTAILNDWKTSGMAAVKLRAGNIPATLKAVEATWGEVFPQHVFKSDFVDQEVARLYLGEQILLNLAQVFSLIAILIGCGGLYGLVAFMAESRTKEIGIRKVLGARVGQLLWLFGRECSLLILLSFMLAAPLGWWLMRGWLQGYTYHIELNGWIFILTIAVAVGITVLTVSYESIKAALMNPVNSLRSE